MTEPKSPPLGHHREEVAGGLAGFFRGYFLFILKNVIGWIFLLASPVLGLALPGPGGIPVFLIGFALVTFPGKRRLTSRVMRGRPFDIEARIFTFLTAVVSVLITWLLLMLFLRPYIEELKTYNLHGAQLIAQLVGICLLALVVTWLVARLALHVLNWFLTRMPVLRRRIRPWLRKHGVHLLPPRRKRIEPSALGATAVPDENEILVFHERHHHRLRYVWGVFKPWLRRAIAVGITVAMFFWILTPIFDEWTQIRDHIYSLSVVRFAVAAGMFAAFLFFFRVLVWRRILQAFGHTLPVAAATRIWSTSELARYLPGVVWQVVGRIYLVQPYGVRGSVCSVSQILELSLFLLANMLVAIACLLYFGIKNLEGVAESWLYAVAGLVPVMLLLIHPRIFYAIINWTMDRFGKPHVRPDLGGLELTGLLLWNIVGLLWQSLALYLILEHALGLKLDWWWVLAGAYCLAWTAGFLAVWAPGGIGVRELVFVTAMQMALPASVQERFSQPEVLFGFLAFLSMLLRVWTTAGELLLATIAYFLDYRGAFNFPDAPGRIPGAPLSDVDSAA